VRLGVHARLNERSDVTALARRAEELGFESLFVPEHTHIPLTVEREQGDFEPLRQWPKPVQHPHPPILLGGESDRTLERARTNRYEWFPHHSDELLPRLQRGLEGVPASVFAAPRDQGVLASYAGAGAVRCVVQLEPDESVDALAELVP
jgi:alkanesulfonate monooxygenase SsuD/methylene tetrahydromethanopterin reductase-like flavin-dependent oxidoreductase (luciferase family)